MNFENMSIEEIIDYFSDKWLNDEKITLQELREASNVCNLTDPVAGEGAITIFYSGGEDAIANALANSDNSSIRVIRRTDRFKLLSYVDYENKNNSFNAWVEHAIKCENPRPLAEKTAWISSDDALIAIDLNENGYIDDGSELFGTSSKLSNDSYFHR